MNYKYFTSESVASGHPDKICDQISDAVLDSALKKFPKSRVAVETLVTADKVVLAGEVTCSKTIDYKRVASQVIKELGYIDPIYNFTDKSDIDVYIHQQSPDISVGVDADGAGDQGMMFGYATNETTDYMPLPISLSHNLVERMDLMRKTKKIPYLRPDGKSEIKIRYKRKIPVSIEKIVLAVPHDPKVNMSQLKRDLYKMVVVPVVEKYGFKVKSEKLIVNGTGRWEVGGPATDTGVTGRKIIVDSYGGMARIGGGAFSGKDPTKVDRSGAYAARYLAKNIVANGLADKVEVQLAYVIGHAEPITKSVETFGTEKTKMSVIEDFAFNKLLELSVRGIIDGLDLQRPIYKRTARYGHFGRKSFPWEKICRF